jgi:hypothetical protein
MEGADELYEARKELPKRFFLGLVGLMLDEDDDALMKALRSLEKL